MSYGPVARRVAAGRRWSLPTRRGGVVFSPDTAREMSVVSAILFGSAAAVVALTLLTPGPPAEIPWLVAGTVGAAFVAAGVHLALARSHRPLPLWWFVVSSIAGAAAICAVVIGAGVSPVPYGLFLLYIVGFVSYYYPMRWAVGVVVVSCAAYGVAQLVVGGPDPLDRWLLVTSASVVGAGAVGVVGRRSRDALERARESEALKASILTSISHEVRTPLTAIEGFAQLLSRRHAEMEAERAAHAAERLMANVERLGVLLADLLDVERLADERISLEIGEVDLESLVTATCERSAEPHRVSVTSEAVRCVVDRRRVERVVDALVSNALRHTPAGSPVEVTVEPEAGGGAHVSVADRGPGVASADRAVIFEPFYQGEEAVAAASPGAGLSLAVAYAWTQAHGGDLWVDEREGGGAVFHLRLPPRPDPPPP